MAEALSPMFVKSKEASMHQISHFNIEVSHPQFADDTITSIDSMQVLNLKILLQWFEMISGLQITYSVCYPQSLCG